MNTLSQEYVIKNTGCGQLQRRLRNISEYYSYIRRDSYHSSHNTNNNKRNEHMDGFRNSDSWSALQRLAWEQQGQVIKIPAKTRNVQFNCGVHIFQLPGSRYISCYRSTNSTTRENHSSVYPLHQRKVYIYRVMIH